MKDLVEKTNSISDYSKTELMECVSHCDARIKMITTTKIKNQHSVDEKLKLAGVCDKLRELRRMFVTEYNKR
jgi:hypothetical protein